MIAEQIAAEAFHVRVSGLDPITLVLLHVAPERGRLQVECYGRTWNCHLNGLGGRSPKQCLGAMDADELADRLQHGRVRMLALRDREQLRRIAATVLDAIRGHPC